MKKLILLSLISIFVSCEKEMEVEPQNTEDYYLRVETVSKDGVKEYSPVSHIKIK